MKQVRQRIATFRNLFSVNLLKYKDAYQHFENALEIAKLISKSVFMLKLHTPLSIVCQRSKVKATVAIIRPYKRSHRSSTCVWFEFLHTSYRDEMPRGFGRVLVSPTFKVEGHLVTMIL